MMEPPGPSYAKCGTFLSRVSERHGATRSRKDETRVDFGENRDESLVSAERDPSKPFLSAAGGSNPIFVVGCSRSGTTLLQSILNQHPSLVSFPECNVLYKVLDDLAYRRFGKNVRVWRIPLYLIKRLLNRLGYTFSYSPKKFHAYLAAIGHDDLAHMVPPKTMSMKPIFKAFHEIRETLAQGRRYVEKTPQNIFCIEFIERLIPNAQFVHIVRDGKENVASLIAAAEKFEGFQVRFGGKGRLSKAVSYWNNALRISYRYRNNPRHVVVRYEDVVANPREALAETARFLGIELTEEMYRYETDGLIFDFEVHKKNYSKLIVLQPMKFDLMFTSQEKKIIEDRLLDVDSYYPRRFVAAEPGPAPDRRPLSGTALSLSRAHSGVAVGRPSIRHTSRDTEKRDLA